MAIDFPTWLPAAFFLIAFVYSMAGLAGGSSYLAVLILAGLTYKQVPSVALFCNLIVSTCAFWHFYRGGHFDFKKVLPFVLLSIPAAYFGGSMMIGKQLFCFLLGLSLLVAGARMLLPEKKSEATRLISDRERWLVGLPVGAALGFLSGLVGIGGGIFLSPILLLIRWANAKQAAAAASFFILVNSFSGLLGQAQKAASIPFSEPILFLGLVVFIGGQIGASIGSYRLPRFVLQKIAGILILYVSINLIGKAF